MRLNRLILAATCALLSTTAFAQTGKVTGTPFGSGDDSLRCRKNISLLTSLGKTGDYADALKYWQQAYDECPGSSKNIYIVGAKILQWQLSNAKTPQDKQALLDKLMKLYDDRITYFGDDANKGADAITLDKIGDYSRIVGADNLDYNLLYSWVSPMVARYKEKTVPTLLYYYVLSSRNIAVKNKDKSEDYIKTYLEASELLDKALEEAGDNAEARKPLEDLEKQLDSDFAQSGLAGCDVLAKIYPQSSIDEHKKDKEYLQGALALYDRADCDSPVVEAIGRYLFEIEPTFKAAMGMAGAAYRGKKYGEANTMLQRAISLAGSSADRLKCYELLFAVATQSGNGQAHTWANKILSENPRSGKILMYLAESAAGAASRYYPNDKIKQRCYYYLIINKLRHAASVDPSVASQANSRIAYYSRFLPSAQEIFMYPGLKGSRLTFGGESIVVP